ncbi:MAG TPA: hypothetical protein VF021_11190 [Longimicrobiales bacterium]
MAAAAVLVGGPVHSQTVTLDEGAYRISVGGKEVGTETFSIRQNGSGDGSVIIAVGRVVLDAERGQQEVSSELQVAGRSLRPAAYEVRVQGAGAQRITGRVVGGRFSAQIVSSAGESMREYLAGDGAVLADDGVAHHYYFLARRVQGGSARVPVIIPRQNRQVIAQVTAAGSESLTVGGKTLAARKLSITPAGTPERLVWVDTEGRVLRLEIPSSGFVAARVEAPR